MEFCSLLCGRLDGRGVWGRMGTYICVVESLCCLPETITTLLIGYTLIKIKSLKKVSCAYLQSGFPPPSPPQPSSQASLIPVLYIILVVLEFSEISANVHFSNCPVYWDKYGTKYCLCHLNKDSSKNHMWKMIVFNYLFSLIFISWRLITLQFCSGFCHTLTRISHGFTCVPHPNPPSPHWSVFKISFTISFLHPHSNALLLNLSHFLVHLLIV